MWRLARLDLHEIAHRRSFGRVQSSLEKVTRRLGAEDLASIMQLVAGAVLCHHTRKPPPFAG
jgi:hypothetical protein